MIEPTSPRDPRKAAVIPALLGWAGMAGTLAAYALVWRGLLVATSWQYAALNAIGGVLGGVASALYGAWPAAASNAVWAAIGVHSLIRIARGVTHAAVTGHDAAPARAPASSARRRPSRSPLDAPCCAPGMEETRTAETIGEDASVSGGVSNRALNLVPADPGL